jgi:UDP-N-acetylglucosamine 2-epimerase
MMKTVLSVVGTRPEVIKMAPVIRALEARADEVTSVVCATGQHRELLDQALDLFGIVPDHRLDVMRDGRTLAEITASLITGLDSVVREVKPDWVLGLGDTTTVFASAVAANYQGAKFAHLEGGLRSGDKRQPFPEEINRLLADSVADLFFSTGPVEAQRLLDAGVDPSRVHVSGNTVIDAIHMVSDRAYDWSAGPMKDVPEDERLVLVTAHRRESFGGPIRDVCGAVADLAGRFAREGVHFVFPVHLNPEVRPPAHEILGEAGGVHLLEPLDYLSLVQLLKRCELVLTDSGGIQEEAPALGVPVLVLREVCEQAADVDSGAAVLVGTDRDRIVTEASSILGDPAVRERMSKACTPGGDGRAAQRVVEVLLST